MDKNINRQLTEEEIQMANKHAEMFILTSNQGHTNWKNPQK